MTLWNINHNRREWQRRMGDISQAVYVRKSVLDDGPGRGMRVWEAVTGSGFAFTVLPDRCLDIAQCSYKGIPLSFISRVGLIHPHHYGDDAFMRSFTGGLLTTCGSTYMGAPCVDCGEQLGLHGRLHAAAADDTFAFGKWIGDDFILKMQGYIRETRMFGEHVTLCRTITSQAGESCLLLHDEITNDGFTPVPLMMLYHFNFGYPIVSEHSTLTTGETRSIVRPRDEAAQRGLAVWNRFDEPVCGFKEQVFYHDLAPDADGYARACLFNNELQVGAYLRFHMENLPHLIQWKSTCENDYVCGLEPGTWYPEGRDKARERGELRFMQPGETVTFDMEVGVALP